MSVNKVILVGNLGQNPELAKTQDGKNYCRFSVATTDSYDKSTEWFDCVAFGKTAENIVQYFSKGQPIFVEGRFKSKEYEGKKTWTVMVSGFSFIGGQKKGE